MREESAIARRRRGGRSGGRPGAPEGVTYVRAPVASTDAPCQEWIVDRILSIRSRVRLPGGIARGGTVLAEPRAVTFLRFLGGTAPPAEAARIDVPRDPSEVAAFWIEPHPRVLARVAEEGLDPREASIGVARLLRVFSGLYAPGPLDEIVAGDVRGVAGVPPGSVFLLARRPARAAAALDHCEEILRDALEIVQSCGCGKGCPSCVGVHQAPPVRRARGGAASPPAAAAGAAAGAVRRKEAAAWMLQGLLRSFGRGSRGAQRGRTAIRRRVSEG